MSSIESAVELYDKLLAVEDNWARARIIAALFAITSG